MALFIDGQWHFSGSAGAMSVVSPATGEVVATLPMAGANELSRTIESAQRGFQVWRNAAPADRCAVILRAAKLIRDRKDSIARTMTLEQGKPLRESDLEVIRAAELIEWAAEEGRRIYGQTIPAPQGQRYTTYYEPIGVVLALTPWNFPAVAPARKVGSSLAAGCSCILKPSEITPNTAIEIVKAFEDAGLPAGVLNLVLGDPRSVTEELIASPVVRKITFTGSVAVGKQLAELCARQMKPSLMELGGHSPVIVFPDVDVERIAEASTVAKFRNAGQVCTSPTRFYVHDDVFEKFAGIFAAESSKILVGDGLDPATQMGPLVSARRVAAIEALVNDARSAGAKLLAGGERVKNKGNFYMPTVLAEVPETARVMNEEPFGPVAVCQRFSDIDDVLRRANSLPFGLAAYVFTKSIGNANRAVSGLECGIVGLNSFSGSNVETPFGGVKDSGYGREGGTEGVREYMTIKFVSEGSL